MIHRRRGSSSAIQEIKSSFPTFSLLKYKDIIHTIKTAHDVVYLSPLKQGKH